MFVRGEPWQAQTEWTMSTVRAKVLRAAETNEWPATFGEACGFCPIREKCDVLGELSQIGSLRICGR